MACSGNIEKFNVLVSETGEQRLQQEGGFSPYPHPLSMQMSGGRPSGLTCGSAA